MHNAAEYGSIVVFRFNWLLVCPFAAIQVDLLDTTALDRVFAAHEHVAVLHFAGLKVCLYAYEGFRHTVLFWRS